MADISEIPGTPANILGYVQEINILREEVVRLKIDRLALNNTCWYMAEQLGLIGDNVTAVTYPPMELARKLVEQRDQLDRLLQEKP